jgi:membrane-associated phospholipid phosphatase
MGTYFTVPFLAWVLAAPPVPAHSAPAKAPAEESQPAKPGFLRQLGGDFRRTFTSRDSLLILGIGGGAALLARPMDHRIPNSSFNSEPHEGTTLDHLFDPGAAVGDAPALGGASLGILAVGKLAGDQRLAALGSDLVRSLIVSGSITQVLKLATHRERPDGSSQMSFPSGHASASFAMATVAQGRYGPRVGVPAYCVAAWIAASRLNENKHYLSDVIFGAAVGIAAGRGVNLGHGSKRMTVAPQVVPGGGAGVQFLMSGWP